jgi:DNA modification methylase
MADGTIYAGNMRFRAAERLGLASVPAVLEDVSEELAKERALKDNNQWGEWEEDQLAELLGELRSSGVDLALLGFAEKEVEGLLSSLGPGPGLTDPDDLPASAPTRARLGDLWQLGEHRVLCGDASKAEDWARLMAGEQAQVLVTDPPYGVDYQGEDARRRIKNDNLGAAQEAFWRQALSWARFDGDAYIFSPSGPQSSALARAAEAAGIEQHQWLVWVKQQFVLGRSNYHYRHEHIFYGWRARSSFLGSRAEDSVWQEDRPGRSPEHPTMKPVVLFEKAIRNSCPTGGTVLDCFLGSGTALIACERLSRRCLGMEIEARYVDVALERWEKFSGKRAELVARQVSHGAAE